jgi:hypothetical protein
MSGSSCIILNRCNFLASCLCSIRTVTGRNPAVSVAVNLGCDEESEPEEDSYAENIDYDYDPEDPARNLLQSEVCDKEREKECQAIEKMPHLFDTSKEEQSNAETRIGCP